MSAGKLLKITCDTAPKKINAYLKMPSPTFAYLYKEIEQYLEERELPPCKLRTYWIDTDGDEIDIMNQCDYEVFMTKFASLGRDMHMLITPLQDDEAAKVKAAWDASSTTGGAASSVNVDDPSNFVIHDHVECDACGLSPLVGFRYKCLQCHNFDLCQSCEAAHKHADHMLVRIPDPSCPSVIDAWVSNDHYNGSRRRGSKRKGHCPFAEAAAAACGGVSAATGTTGGEAAASAKATTTTAAPEPEHRHGHHGRKHHRRHVRHGFLSNLYDMMQDLAETSITAAAGVSTPPRAPEDNPKSAANASETSEKTTKSNEESKYENSKPIHEPSIKAAAEPTVEKIKAQTTAEAIPSTSLPKTTTLEQDKEELNQEKAPQQEQQYIPIEPAIAPANINLESLAQVVPPEYMRAGIEILNNFSEMFAKMLDPAEGATGNFPTYVGTPKDARKNSNASATSSTASSGLSSSSAATAKQASTVNDINVTEQQIPPAVDKSNQKINETSSNSQPETVAPPLGKESRTNSEDGDDWQLIDKHSAIPERNEASLIDLTTNSISSNESVKSNVSNGAASDGTTNATAANISFAQLNENLRRHVEQEAERAQFIKAQVQKFSSAETQTPQVPTVSTSTATTNRTDNTPLAPENKRNIPIYHTDHRINNSVHAMMAMGFSNEGAWLTQLLESVNGNIAEALDVMSASQRK